MMELILQYIPLPFTDNAYEYAVITEQISRKLVIFAHIPTTVVALALTIYLYKNAKNLSSLYLLILTIVVSVWGYLDLLSWTSNAWTLMFGWVTLPTFGASFAFLSYWFLYAFVKGKDLPLWQKILSLLTLIPFIYTVLANTYLGDYDTHAITPMETEFVLIYRDIVNSAFLAIIALFTFVEYRRAQDFKMKQQTLFAGLGVFVMLFFFTFSQLIATILQTLGFLVGDVANVTLYSLFGIPILIASLGYLIARYQAFGFKILVSVGCVILLMVLLFMNIFI